MNRLLLLLLLFAVLILPSCSVAQKAASRKNLSKKEQKALDLKLEESEVFSKHFTGFALYDLAEKQMLYEYNSDNYFVPASNTKIFTLFTALKTLGDSIPAIQYSKQGDFMIIWGTGDPSFLNSKLTQNPAVFNFLKTRPERLLFSQSNFTDRRFGSGWMWSDYAYSYQAEKSPFPIYGNLANFRQDSSREKVIAQPPYFEKKLRQGLPPDKEDVFARAEYDNIFYHNTVFPKSNFSVHTLPFISTPQIVADLLTDTLKKEVKVLENDFLPPPDAGTVYSILADSLYKLMMQESDNFVAEQLMLMSSWKQFGNMNTRQMINLVQQEYLKDLPDEPQWVDGSGLSRYNMFTPRSLVVLLEKIYQMVPQERLFAIFPAGGVSGTIRNNYGNGNQPYVFAKTGTLRHNHSLSGYLVTQKGRVLIFSFMHNNFTQSTANIRREMERILSGLRQKL